MHFTYFFLLLSNEHKHDKLGNNLFKSSSDMIYFMQDTSLILSLICENRKPGINSTQRSSSKYRYKFLDSVIYLWALPFDGFDSLPGLTLQVRGCTYILCICFACCKLLLIEKRDRTSMLLVCSNGLYM